MQGGSINGSVEFRQREKRERRAKIRTGSRSINNNSRGLIAGREVQIRRASAQNRQRRQCGRSEQE
jgi:hypothetical protein